MVVLATAPEKWGKILSSRVYPEFFQFSPESRVLNIGCGKAPQAVVYKGAYGEMVGVDINKERIEESYKLLQERNIQNYSAICANVEKIPLEDNSFDHALAVDIIEHVQNPDRVCREAHRLLKENGRLLISFPTLHDKYVDFISGLARFIFRKKKKIKGKEWNPDEHCQEYSAKDWIKLIEGCGFKLEKSRATTLFPPLHYYGIPRFWFSNNFIHRIDSSFCKLPRIKNYGQALLCLFIKK